MGTNDTNEQATKFSLIVIRSRHAVSILRSYQGSVPLPSLQPLTSQPYPMTLPAVVAAVVAADHLLDLLEQRLGVGRVRVRVRVRVTVTVRVRVRFGDGVRVRGRVGLGV